MITFVSMCPPKVPTYVNVKVVSHIPLMVDIAWMTMNVQQMKMHVGQVEDASIQKGLSGKTFYRY